MLSLLPHQQRAANSAVIAFGYYRVCLGIAPTRSGKTVIGLEIARRLGLDVVVATPRLEVAEQWLATAEQHFPGRWRGTLCGGGQKDSSGTLVAGTLQSLASARGDFFNPQRQARTLFIFDEAHRAASPTGRQLLDAFKRSKTLLLTATPARSDGQRPDQIGVEHIAFEIKSGELERAGVLVKPVTVPHKGDSPADVVEAIRVHSAGQTIVFAGTVDRAEAITAELKRQGVRAACVTGNTPSAARRKALDDYRNLRIQVLVNVLVAVEGVDINVTRTVVLADRPRHETGEIQRVGRALGALAEGFAKTDALVIICSGGRDALPARTAPSKGHTNKGGLFMNDLKGSLTRLLGL